MSFRPAGFIVIFLTLLTVPLFSAPTVSLQRGIEEVMQKDFPSLWKTFGKDASAQRADYVVAVDISASMKKFRNTVIPSVTAFIDSLPDGDYVSIIAFGASARIVGVPAEISPATKKAIRTALETMPFNDQQTDLALMSDKILTELNRPGGSDLKFVFAFTDFDHDPGHDRKGKEGWGVLAERFLAEHAGHQVDFYAMKLQLTEKSGRDLGSVASVFNGLQTIPVNAATLGGWFQRRKEEILRDRLKFIVSRALAAPPPELTAICEGSEIKAKLNPVSKNVLISGLTVQTAEFAKGTAGLIVSPGTFPVSLETAASGSATLGTIAAGPLLLNPTPSPRVALKTKWIFRSDAGEMSKLGCRLPESPALISPSGQLSPPGRLEFRAYGSTIEVILLGASPGVGLRIDAANFPTCGDRTKPVLLPLVLEKNKWTVLARIPAADLISRSVSAGKADIAAAFVTASQPNAATGNASYEILGGISTGRFDFLSFVVAAALAAALLLYAIFCFRPGRRFMGKLEFKPPAATIRLQSASKLAIMRASKEKLLSPVVAQIPEGLHLELYVSGGLLHPLRGIRRVIVKSAAGPVEISFRSGRIDKKQALKRDVHISLPPNLREFQISHAGWRADWARN